MRGDGSVFKTTNNGKPVWAYRWRQNNRPHTKFFPRTEEGRKAAEALKKAKRGELQSGIKGCSLSLHDSIVNYLETYKLHDVRPSTYQRHVDTLYAIPKWLREDIPLDQITTSDIKKGMNELAEQLSTSSIRKVYDIINATYKAAIADKKVTDNPVSALKRPQLEVKEKAIYTDSEIFRLFRTIRHVQTSGVFHSMKHDYYTIFLLLLTTGVRIGEALALRWEDFDWTEGQEEVHIQRTLDSHCINKDKTKKGTQRFNSPKTSKGDRFIPLFSRHLIKRLKAMRPSENPVGQIFATASGNALSYQNFAKTWSAIGREYARRCPKCGQHRPNDWECPNHHHITRRRTQCPICKEDRPRLWICPNCGTTVSELHKSPHTTRHTFVSYMLNHGIPIKYVQAIAGHADSSVTVDTYGHAPKHLRDEVKSTYRK